MSNLNKIKYDVSYKLSWMPKQAKTAGQKVLQEKHGTPYVFAKACYNAIGEISVAEFHAAITKYKKEWLAC